ncbi:hypothetical protein J2X54_000197 [Duganella sp. 3397]|uniref:hypothetical protein n=1 Tax=Duganella sp. 3397 TaxID=2817732 RepID=UPI0028650AEE|nr:hypothetical protein [Duganella sp. 3397]MDR7047762.1 hypothetical protein [Duganella sp. 3397]
MQSKLLEIVRAEHAGVRRVLDPFMGAGTMLTEVMEQGLDFAGYDINPLAILACKVKAGPFSTLDLKQRSDALLAQIAADTGRSYEASFDGMAKWFSKSTSIGLSRICRSIKQVEDLWTRQFYWLCLAETIRQCSNSRTSTYKLHIKPNDEESSNLASTIEIFKNTVSDNVSRVIVQNRLFSESGVIDAQGKYSGSLDINFQDVTTLNSDQVPEKFDLLFTSPPYGDNTTTIPYGQFSYLALNWIPAADICQSIPLNINKNTHSIDSASIGGSLKNSKIKAESLFEKSESFKEFFLGLGDEKSSHSKRLSSFCFDLHKGVEAFSKLMAPSGYMVWTLGNRSLAGQRVPLDKIVFELLEHHNIRRVAQFVRPIPSKRMPNRNKSSNTMDTEIVIIAGA